VERKKRMGSRASVTHAIGLTFAFAMSMQLALPVEAATLRAVPGQSVIQLGETITIDIFVDLAPGEVASVFEARFDIVGLGTVASLDRFVADGPTWDLTEENVAGNRGTVSLLSDNAGGSRLSVSLDLTALAEGEIAIVFAPNFILERDIQSFPFLESVPLTTPVGSTLSTVSVVPEPSTGLLVAMAVAALGRRRQAWAPEASQ